MIQEGGPRRRQTLISRQVELNAERAHAAYAAVVENSFKAREHFRELGEELAKLDEKTARPDWQSQLATNYGDRRMTTDLEKAEAVVRAHEDKRAACVRASLFDEPH
jgi:predicted hydrocarbon binding protein